MDAFGRLSASAKLKATDYASSAISSVKSSLRDLNGRSATTTINVITRRHTITTSSGGGHQATGGMNSVPVIPRHASGYIATGPTLTNQGWIGEDGIEAVANWATGGAVVPLTNKRYMLPIADAIADGMAKRMGESSAPQVSVVVNGVSSPEEVARAITNALSLTL